MTKAEYEAKKQFLLSEIERVFGGVERDSNVTEEIKAVSTHLARGRKQLLSMGPRWQEIPDQWIEDGGGSLLFSAGPHSIRHYLPAYLSLFLRSMDLDDTQAFKNHLTLNRDSGILMVYEKFREHSIAKFALLSPEQSIAVAHYLIFQCERCVFLYQQEELAGPESNYRFGAFTHDLNHKTAYRHYQLMLDRYWGQFLGADYVQGEFPFLGPSRRWRETIAGYKVIEPQRLAAYENRKSTLIAEIERAFDGIEREDGISLHQANAIDDYASPEELAEAKLSDTETRWQDVPDEDIQYSVGLSYFDDKGLRYYLPAYLIWYLRFVDYEAEDFNSGTFESIAYVLGVRFSEFDQSSLAQKFSSFSEQQKRAIAHFVEFKHEQLNYRAERWNYTPEPEQDWDEEAHAEIQRALDKYWSQFL